MRAATGFDVAVIGAGATGIWAAQRLARKGLSVVVIEAGGLPFGPAVKRSGSADGPEYTHPKGRPFVWNRTRALGGRTNSWGRVSLRMSDLDFQAPAFDGYGECWPISHADLSPHYARVERTLRVRGHEDRLPQIPDGRFEGYEVSEAHAGFKALIELRWPGRRVVAGRYAQRNFVPLLSRGMKSGAISVILEHSVIEIVVSGDGRRATGVVLRDAENRTLDLRVRSVALCGSTIDSTRLLLSSTSRHHRAGLGSSSGQLGRNLMDHTMVDCSGVLPLARRRGAIRAGFSVVPRFQNLVKPNGRYLRGFGVLIYQEPCGEAERGAATCSFRASSPSTRHVHVVMRSFGEVLPRRTNRVTLDPRARDAFGLPLPRIDFRYSENEERMMREQVRTLREIARLAGLEGIREHVYGPGESNHEVGTARMGSDPSTSVVSSHCQSWDVPNVYVMDGSCFVTSGFQNPTLTMVALCDRACEHLARSLK